MQECGASFTCGGDLNAVGAAETSGSLELERWVALWHKPEVSEDSGAPETPL